jgi:2-dehydropantoate 2-reductase
MRICVFGAGAIGGYAAAHLAAAGRTDVSLVARGAHLDAITTSGLKLIEGGTESMHRLRASADAAALGPQDFVLVALKAHSIGPALDAIAPLLGPDTAVVTMQNGIPWWYFYRHGGELDGKRLAAVDPGGHIWERIGPQRVIGSVVYPAAEVPEPGVILHLSGTRCSLGEPSGERTERLVALSGELVAAGLQAPIRSDIRAEIWVKLWGNLAFNPLSALTGLTLEGMVRDGDTRTVARQMMIEAQIVAERLGIRFPIDVDQRIQGAGNVGAHKTSMLQDLERGRPVEIDALVTAVQEVARLVDVKTPAIDTVLALVRQVAAARGSYSLTSAAA